MDDAEKWLGNADRLCHSKRERYSCSQPTRYSEYISGTVYGDNTIGLAEQLFVSGHASWTGTSILFSTNAENK